MIGEATKPRDKGGGYSKGSNWCHFATISPEAMLDVQVRQEVAWAGVVAVEVVKLVRAHTAFQVRHRMSWWIGVGGREGKVRSNGEPPKENDGVFAETEETVCGTHL